MGLLIALGVIILFLLIGLGTAVNLVQQGFNGVVTRFGRYHREVGSGICLIWPFFDRIVRVDMRETPRTGDRQDVITRDNVAVAVNATIFSQVIDAKAALFNVSNYFIAIDQQARTTLRNAFGNVSLDEALSSREQINAAMQQQMEQVTDKWGIRIKRRESGRRPSSGRRVRGRRPSWRPRGAPWPSATSTSRSRRPLRTRRWSPSSSWTP
jgi:regulator of protease activity HflC (stomatin/prohibitin superfamily)